MSVTVGRREGRTHKSNYNGRGLSRILAHATTGEAEGNRKEGIAEEERACAGTHSLSHSAASHDRDDPGWRLRGGQRPEART